MMNDSERVFRLRRKDGETYWSGPYNTADGPTFRQADADGWEVRHLSIAAAFDAAKKEETT